MPPRGHPQHTPDGGHAASPGEDTPNAAKCLDSWAQVIPPAPPPHKLDGGGALAPADGLVPPHMVADAGRSCRRTVSPSTSALLKLTAPDREPLPDPRLALTEAKLELAANAKKTPSWYRRVSIPRNDACSPRQIKVLKLQLEIAKEKNKGELPLTHNAADDFASTITFVLCATAALALDGSSSNKGVRGKHSARTQKAKGKQGESGNVSGRADGGAVTVEIVYGGRTCQFSNSVTNDYRLAQTRTAIQRKQETQVAAATGKEANASPCHGTDTFISRKCRDSTTFHTARLPRKWFNKKRKS